MLWVIIQRKTAACRRFLETNVQIIKFIKKRLRDEINRKSSFFSYPVLFYESYSVKTGNELERGCKKKVISWDKSREKGNKSRIN